MRSGPHVSESVPNKAFVSAIRDPEIPEDREMPPAAL